jgi:hypothetical protein
MEAWLPCVFNKLERVVLAWLGLGNRCSIRLSYRPTPLFSTACSEPLFPRATFPGYFKQEQADDYDVKQPLSVSAKPFPRPLIEPDPRRVNR